MASPNLRQETVKAHKRLNTLMVRIPDLHGHALLMTFRKRIDWVYQKGTGRSREASPPALFSTHKSRNNRGKKCIFTSEKGSKTEMNSPKREIPHKSLPLSKELEVSEQDNVKNGHMPHERLDQSNIRAII